MRGADSKKTRLKKGPTNMERAEQLKNLCTEAKAAADASAAIPAKRRNEVLELIADRLLSDTENILEANRIDCEALESEDLPADDAERRLQKRIISRLKLDEGRIGALCDSLIELSRLPDPIGNGDIQLRPSGVEVRRIRVPLGCVAFTYDARPDLTLFASAICLKTRNAVVLSGGEHSYNTDIAIVNSIHSILEASGFNTALVTYADPVYNDAPTVLASLRGTVDLLIPYGERRQLLSLYETAHVPVIETGLGNCHIYVDSPCDISHAVKLTINSKCTRTPDASSIETILVHSDVAGEFLPALRRAATPHRIEFRGCPLTREYLPEAIPAVRGDWSAEYNNNILAVKVVGSIDEAIEHISVYGTGNCETILTSSLANSRRFSSEVDAAAIYVNAAVRPSKDSELGAGISLGVSTQKYHVRGPLGLEALTSEKYIVSGDKSVK